MATINLRFYLHQLIKKYYGFIKAFSMGSHEFSFLLVLSNNK